MYVFSTRFFPHFTFDMKIWNINPMNVVTTFTYIYHAYRVKKIKKTATRSKNMSENQTSQEWNEPYCQVSTETLDKLLTFPHWQSLSRFAGRVKRLKKFPSFPLSLFPFFPFFLFFPLSLLSLFPFFPSFPQGSGLDSLACRTRRLSGAVLRVRPKKTEVPCHVQQVWHDKESFLLQAKALILQPFTGNGDVPT